VGSVVTPAKEDEAAALICRFILPASWSNADCSAKQT